MFGKGPAPRADFDHLTHDLLAVTFASGQMAGHVLAKHDLYARACRNAALRAALAAETNRTAAGGRRGFLNGRMRWMLTRLWTKRAAMAGVDHQPAAESVPARAS
jgi:hypothetical protein